MEIRSTATKNTTNMILNSHNIINFMISMTFMINRVFIDKYYIAVL